MVRGGRERSRNECLVLCMDKDKTKTKEESGGEGVVGGVSATEVVFEGVSLGEGMSPVSGRVGGKRVKRVRSLSEGSPEQLGKEDWCALDLESKVRGCTKRVNVAINELKVYVAKNVSKEKHEPYFSARFNRVLDAQNELVGEYMSMSKMFRRILSLEKKVKDVVLNEEGEFDKRFEEMESRLMKGVREENRMAMEKMRSEMERSRKLLEEEDAQRSSDVERLEAVVKLQKKELEKKFEEEMLKIRKAYMQVDGSLRVLNEEQKKKMDVSLKEVAGVKESMEDVRRCMNEAKLEGSGVAEVGLIVKGMDEVKKRMDELVVESGKVRSSAHVEQMEVDSDERIGWSEVVKRGKKKRGPLVVIERTEKVGVREAREELVRCLDPTDGDIRVRSIRRQGRNFVLEVHDEDDLGRLREIKRFEEVGFKVDGEPNLSSPRVVVHDVDGEMKEEEVAKSVWRKNGRVFEGVNEEEFREKFKIKHRVGLKGRSASWVAQVDPQIFKRLIREERLYVGLRCCRVREYVDVLRCFKCQGLGHVGRWCGRPVTCRRGTPCVSMCESNGWLRMCKL